MAKGQIAAGTGSWIGLAAQSEWDHAFSSATSWKYLPVISFSGGLEATVQSRDDLTTTASKRGYWKTGKKTKWSSTHYLDYEGHEQWLKRAFGACSSAAQGGTAAYAHTFTLANTPILCALDKCLDSAVGSIPYPANIITAVEFSVDGPFDPVKVTYEYFGREEDALDTTPATPTFPDDHLVIPCEGGTGGTVTIASTPYSITKWRVRMENPFADGAFYIGTTLTMGQPGREAKRSVTGEVTTWFDATEAGALYALYRGQTEASVEIDYQRDVAATGYNYTFNLNMGRVIPTGTTPDVSGAGMVELTLPFEAYSAADGSPDALVGTLVNLLTSVT